MKCPLRYLVVQVLEGEGAWETVHSTPPVLQHWDADNRKWVDVPTATCTEIQFTECQTTRDWGNG